MQILKCVRDKILFIVEFPRILWILPQIKVLKPHTAHLSIPALMRPDRMPPGIPSGIEMYGPPGTGRTFLAEALARVTRDIPPERLRDPVIVRSIREWGTTLNFITGLHAQAAKIDPEAQERAKALLFEFLTDKQKEQAQNGFVVEKSEFGSYRIPLTLGRVRFEPTGDKKKLGELTKFLRALKYAKYTDPMNALARKHFHADLCLSNTGADARAPWHDAVLTLLLHIRTGNEKELWRKAVVTYMSWSSQDNTAIERLPEREERIIGCIHAGARCQTLFLEHLER